MLHFFFKLWRSISVIHTSHSRQQLETSHTAKEVDLNVGGSKYHIGCIHTPYWHEIGPVDFKLMYFVFHHMSDHLPRPIFTHAWKWQQAVSSGKNLYLFGNIAALSSHIIYWEGYFMLHHHNHNFAVYHHKHKADFWEDPVNRSITSQLGNATLEAGKLEALLDRVKGQGASEVHKKLLHFLARATSALQRKQSWRLGHSFLQSALPHRPWSSQGGHRSLSCCHKEAQQFSRRLSWQQSPDVKCWSI